MECLATGEKFTLPNIMDFMPQLSDFDIDLYKALKAE
jgi:predicted transcriptional regulator